MTKVLFFTPGIKDKNGWFEKSLFDDVDYVYLSNPIHQKKIVSTHADKCFCEDDFENTADLSINETAKSFAADWYLNIENEEAEHEYHGIALGGLHRLSMTYYFVGVLKALWVCENLIKEKQTQEIVIVSDGTYWELACQVVAQKQGCAIQVLNVSDVLESSVRKVGWKQRFKKVLESLKCKDLEKEHPKGVLFSSAMRYVQPFLQGNDFIYYLREEFSVKAARWEEGGNLLHLTPGTLKHKEQITQHFFETNSLQAKNYSYRGYSIWPIIREKIESVLNEDFSASRKHLSCLEYILDKMKLRAIVVDEDVCPFNNALVKLANKKGIPTYCLLHGVPYFDVGFSPLTANHVLAWGNSSRERLESWGIEKSRVIEVGAPQYDGLSEQVQDQTKIIREQYQASSGKKMILFATQPFHTNEKPDFINSPLSLGIIEKTVSLLMGYVKKDTNVVAVLKLHPRDQNAFFTETLIDGEEESVRSRVIIEKQKDTLSLLRASDFVLTLGSTVYFEALLLKKSVAILDDADSRHFQFMCDQFIDWNSSEDFFKKVSGYLSGSIQIPFDEFIEKHFNHKNVDACEQVRQCFGRLPESAEQVVSA